MIHEKSEIFSIATLESVAQAAERCGRQTCKSWKDGYNFLDISIPGMPGMPIRSGIDQEVLKLMAHVPWRQAGDIMLVTHWNMHKWCGVLVAQEEGYVIKQDNYVPGGMPVGTLQRLILDFSSSVIELHEIANGS